MSSPDGRLPLRHAVALGLIHGPAELLPVSSSGHTALVPWLAGWPYERLEASTRKSFEIALHAGAGAALAVDFRRSPAGAGPALPARALVLALAPGTLAGLALRGAIERRAGPGSIAAGLAAGAAAMALADRRAGQRTCEQAGARDGLTLGVAQSLALVPGVSRNGAALTAARALGFARAPSHALSWQAGLPMILGAGAAESVRLARGRVPSGAGGALAAGALAAFASTLASARIIRRADLARGPLLPYALYRALLAALVVRRLRRTQTPA